MNKVSNNCYTVSKLEDIDYKTLYKTHGIDNDFIIDWSDGTTEHCCFEDNFTVVGLTIRPDSETEFSVTLNDKQEPICYAS